jgi:undecaprenyl-diphosphatase
VASAVRSPTDVLRLVVALVLLVVVLLLQWLVGDTLVDFAGRFTSGLGAVPSWLVDLIVVVTRALAVVLIVGGLVVTVVRGRWRFLVTVALAAAVAAALELLAESFAPDGGKVVTLLGEAFGPLQRPGFPRAAGIAAVSALVTAAAPWVERRWRRAGWALVLGLAVVHFVSTAVSFDALRSVVIGWLVGAVVLLALGGPSRRPSGEAIAAGLARVGVPLERLEQASLDARGSTPYFATDRRGGRLFVKALGEDQRSADLLFRLYRWSTRHDLGDERPFSTLRRAVEHEALLALAARDVGVRTPRLVAVATAEPNGFVLAYEAIAGRSLDRLAPDEVDDELLAAIWAQVVLLRRHRIAHRDLRLANLFLADDHTTWAIDFGFSELAASDLLLASDVAELVASSATLVGAPRAVEHAVTAVGPDGIGAALARLRPWALSGATRSALHERPGLLAEVRTACDSVGARSADRS